MLVNYRVSLEFVSCSDSELAVFAGNVAKGLTKNTSFPNPPVSPANLTTLADTLQPFQWGNEFWIIREVCT